MILDANAQSAVVVVSVLPMFLSAAAAPVPSTPPRVLADISAAGVTVRRVTGSVQAVRRITGGVEFLS